VLIPEKRLLAAVLQRAITDFVSGDGELHESAKTWLLDDEEGDAPVSFSFICEALDLDEDSLRRAIIDSAGNISLGEATLDSASSELARVNRLEITQKNLSTYSEGGKMSGKDTKSFTGKDSSKVVAIYDQELAAAC
jgi:hypothetical protein